MGILDTLGDFGLDPRELAKRLDPRQLIPQGLPGGRSAPYASPATPPFMPPAPTGQPGPVGRTAAPAGAGTGQPGKVAAPIAPAAQAPTPGPAQQRYETDVATGAPKLKGIKNVLDIAGQFLAPRLEEAIPGTPGHYNQQIGKEAALAKEEQGLATGQTAIGKTLADTSEAEARTTETNTRAALEQAQLGRPKLLTGDQDTATANGLRYNKYENPDGSTQWVKEGDTPTFSGAVPSTAGPGKIANPPTQPTASQPSPQTAGLPAGATIGRTPNPTPEEQAKLAPVGPKSDVYTRQIADLPGIKPADFPIAPNDTTEQAEKTLANARSQSEAMARKAAEERGAAAETRANQTEDIKPVQATDPKTGKQIITDLGDARKLGLENVIAVGSKEIDTAKATVTNVNLMEQALKNLKENISDIDALSAADKRDVNTILNARELVPEGGALGYVSGSLGQMLNSALSQAEYSRMSEPAKNILRSIITLRESSLGLGKLETGGSRAMQAAIDAINATIPGRPLQTSKDAEQQLRQFADRLDEIQKEAPLMKGDSFRSNPFATAAPAEAKPAKFVNGQWVDATTNKPIPATK